MFCPPSRNLVNQFAMRKIPWSLRHQLLGFGQRCLYSDSSTTALAVHQDLTFSASSSSIQVGDLIELWRNGKSCLGVVVKVPFQDYAPGGFPLAEFTTLLGNGHIQQHYIRNVSFHAPDWLSSFKAVDSKFKGALASNDIPSSNSGQISRADSSEKSLTKDAGLPSDILHQLRTFQQTVEEMMFGINDLEETGRDVNSLEPMYMHFLTQNRKWITSLDAASWKYGKDHSLAQLYVIHQQLLSNGFYFEQGAFGKPWNQMRFFLRDRDEIQSLRPAIDELKAIRIGKTLDPKGQSLTPRLDSFLDKVKLLRAAEGGEGSCSKPTFDQTDFPFIDILKRACFEFSPSIHFHKSLANGILARIGLRASDSSTVVKDIGVWTPWENGMPFWEEFSRPLRLPECSPNAYPAMLEKESQRLATDFVKFGPTCSSPSNDAVRPDVEAQLSDDCQGISAFSTSKHHAEINYQCDALRRDFGDLPIYVIDAENAHELDDGISVERTPEGNWIHIHIADPTYCLKPSDNISRIAHARSTSVYFPERHYPMIPTILTDYLFNLGTSNRALTLSARLDSAGDIADYKVQVSYLKNVKKIPYDAVDAVLNWDKVFGFNKKHESLKIWTRMNLDARRVMTEKAARAFPVKADDSENLLLLQKEVLKHMDQRVRKCGFSVESMECGVTIDPYPYPITPWYPTSSFDARDPTPSITLDPFSSPAYSPSRIVVAECMIIACRIAAKFCTDNQVPMHYRVQRSLIDPYGHGSAAPLRAEMQAKLTEGIDAASGVLPYELKKLLVHLFHPSDISTKPLGHHALGIEGLDTISTRPSLSSCIGYVRLTSPIRRFNDMLAHWQIKAHLIAQHTGMPARYPFSEADIQVISERAKDIETANRISSRSSVKHWILQWMLEREWLAMNEPDVDHPIQKPLPLTYSARKGNDTFARNMVKIAGRPLRYERHQQPLLYNNELTSPRPSPVYTGIISGINPRESLLILELVDLGGVRAAMKRKFAGKLEERIGDVVQVEVEEVDPLNGGRLMMRQV